MYTDIIQSPSMVASIIWLLEGDCYVFKANEIM